MPGLRLRETAESSLCCGNAGIYNVTQAEMAGRLKRRKLDRIAEVDPDVVVTADSGCALQLENGLRGEPKTVPVRHIVEILDASYAAYVAAQPPREVAT